MVKKNVFYILKFCILFYIHEKYYYFNTVRFETLTIFYTIVIFNDTNANLHVLFD